MLRMDDALRDRNPVALFLSCGQSCSSSAGGMCGFHASNCHYRKCPKGTWNKKPDTALWNLSRSNTWANHIHSWSQTWNTGRLSAITSESSSFSPSLFQEFVASLLRIALIIRHPFSLIRVRGLFAVLVSVSKSTKTWNPWPSKHLPEKAANVLLQKKAKKRRPGNIISKLLGNMSSHPVTRLQEFNRIRNCNENWHLWRDSEVLNIQHRNIGCISGPVATLPLQSHENSWSRQTGCKGPVTKVPSQGVAASKSKILQHGNPSI